MADTPRTTPVFAVLNHIPTLCGIKRFQFIGVASGTMILFLLTQQVLLCLGTGFTAYLLLFWMSRTELDYLSLYFAAVALPGIYDAGKFVAQTTREY